MAKPYRVLIGPKVDLDTIATAFLLGVSREDKVEVVRSGRASDEDLANPSVICIEVGGAGRVDALCFDHHEAKGPQLSAAKQAYEAFAFLAVDVEFGTASNPSDAVLLQLVADGRWWLAGVMDARRIFRSNLADYVNLLDTKGPEAFRVALRHAGRDLGDVFPTLSDVIAGMLLVTREPVEQLHRGIESLALLEAAYLDGSYDLEGLPLGPKWREVFRYYLDSEANEAFFVRVHGKERVERFGRNTRIPLFSRIYLPEYRGYVEAKAENNRFLAETVERASWGTTKSGRRLAWLESSFFGAPGALYGHGAEIAVVYNPAFGTPPVRKFTVAGNSVGVTPALERLNALESGWGGPATGTIIGSPREGSALTLEQVVEVVKEAL